MRHFDLIIIGSGSGNTLVDERFADQNVALIDDGARFGGTCLNAGCIPTKMFVLPADALRAPADAARIGVHAPQPTADWKQVRDRIFGRIDPISAGGEQWRAQAPNLTLYRDTACFVGERTLEVAGQTITADRIVIAAGSRTVWPETIEGLHAAAATGRVHTSDTIMRIDEVPKRLVIVGAGYIAAEFAHVFSAFGAQVTVLARSGAMLRNEDAEISRRFTEAAAEYLDLRLHHTTRAIEADAGGVRVRTSTPDGTEHVIEADLLLLATGRRPNSDRIDAAAGGLTVDDDGFLMVDEFQRTNVPGVWALGDVASPWMLKHVANHEARVVQHNLLHPDALIASNHQAIPHAVFAHPQVASVGLAEDAARAAGLDLAVAVQEYGSTAYGWAMEDTTSCVKLIADRATRSIVGAHLIGPQASTLIQPLIQAMATGLDVPTMARGQYWIHPALTEVVENALLSLGLDES
ncbi:MAG: mycothione reductase [Propioniciclava sp.]|uniref:mycothione reductase n=1 Tax=Propioniciclava sp. TaxID=2038686 RepID=UPI0039E2F3A8